MTRDRNELRAGALRRADLPERLGAVAHDAGDVGERLDVVDDGRPLVQPAYRQARRPVARIALLAFDRGDQRRGFAAHVRAGAAIDDEVAREVGAEDALAEIAGRVRFLDRAGEAAVRQVELAADVDEGVPDLQRVGRDQHRLEQQMRRVLKDPAVLERAGLAFVGVRAEIVRLAVVQMDDLPFAADRKRRAAVPEQAGSGDFLGHVLGLHRREHLAQRAVAAARLVVGEQVRGRRDREGHDRLGAGHVSRSSSASSFAASTFS
ncbi:MAG: hypothetical protein L6Q72_15555 [Burkholderiaceae bacterium]|nr:hypothetical protein [Burkholderiaceae bacterium]